MDEPTTFSMERFEEAIAGKRPELLSDGEKLKLGMILMHPLMQKALALTFWQLSDMGSVTVGALNLTSLTGIAAVIKLQGIVTGSELFIQTLGAQALRQEME